MTQTKHIYIAAAILAALVVAAIIGHACISNAKNVASEQAVKQMVAEQTKQLRSDLAAELAKIDADKKQTITPQQIVVKIPEYVPGLPVAPQVVTSNEDHARSAPTISGVFPDSPSVNTATSSDDNPRPARSAPGLYFPEEDVKPLFDRLADCKSSELKLDECKAENSLLTTRAEFAEKAMKGGGFWSRLKSNSKWFIIGGVAGAAAVAARR